MSRPWVHPAVRQARERWDAALGALPPGVSDERRASIERKARHLGRTTVRSALECLSDLVQHEHELQRQAGRSLFGADEVKP